VLDDTGLFRADVRAAIGAVAPRWWRCAAPNEIVGCDTDRRHRASPCARSAWCESFEASTRNA
jgi:hypothetical protein